MRSAIPQRGGPRVVAPLLHHVNLKTVRLGEMIEWYGIVLDMAPNHVCETGAWLTNDAANHRLALLAVPGLADDTDKLVHTGMHHIGFEYPSMDDLLDTYERLKQGGIVPHGCLDHGMTTSLYYVDPDGNSLELQCDNFAGDWARSTEFVRSAPEFAANPIGTQIDPDQLCAARRAGMSADEIHRRAYAGEYTPATPLDLRLPPT
jgi:catechol 2,3-dioxygenase